MIKVLSIAVFTGPGSSDKIRLILDIPEGAYPFNDRASSEIAVATGRGEEYVRTYFPSVPYKVIHVDF